MMNIMFFDGVETQERSEIKDHGISDKVMYFSALRKEIYCALEPLKVQSVKFARDPAL